MKTPIIGTPLVGRTLAGLALFSLLATPLAAAAPSYVAEAPIAFMTDLNSGAVLFSRDADKQIPPASMAKMMTTYVAFDLLKKGELTLDQKMTVSPDTWRKWNNQGSSMFLAVGSQVSVADLLDGIVTLSGNDACVVLAEGIAGSEEAFVDMMNKKAREIGLTNSRFGNSNGWPDEGVTQVTARDLAQLATATIRNHPRLYKRFYSKGSFTWNGITQPNRDPLLGKVDGADGLKTGHTEEAGYGFTGSAEQNGRRLVMVVAGLDSYNGRINESVRFMNWGFRSWKAVPLFAKGKTVDTAPVQMGSVRQLSLVAPRDLALTLPRTADTEAVTLKVVYQGPLKAPIAKGQQVATLVVSAPDMERQVMPLVAGEAVEEAGFFGRLWAGILSLFGA
ncbi:MAG: D-alanyl-D-alanine carboxypeptidase [Blastomonas sp.]|nr:D-alanyl-D-alanine carboxypeptidase [Blastomonas sp.]